MNRGVVIIFPLLLAACGAGSSTDEGPKADLDAPLGPASEFLIQDVREGLPPDPDTRRHTNSPLIAEDAVKTSGA